MTDAMTKHPLYLIMNYQRLSRLLPTCTTGQSSRQLRYVGVGVPFVLLAVVPISAMAVTDETQSISQSMTQPISANFEQKTVGFNQLFINDKQQEQPLLDDAHVDETLTALRLKQAVEAGIIDAKVLEDYRKNTLKSLQSTQAVQNSITADASETNKQGQIINVDDNLNNSLSADGLPQASSWQNLQQDAKQAQAQQYQMQSIQELEQHAQQVATYTQGLLNSPKSVPVAKLDDATDDATSNIQPTKTVSAITTITTAQQINDVVEQNQQDVQTSLGQFGYEQIPAQVEQIKQQTQPNTSNQTTPTTKADKSVNVFKRLYANLFSDGYLPLPRLDANIYLKVPANDGNPNNDRLIKVDTNSQPAKNIKASLEDLFVESVADFKAALPKIRETAKSAAEAVGYYDVQMQFVQTDSNSIDVIIDSVGEPVIVDKRVVEVRNIDGSGKEPLTALQDYLPPLQGEVFNHGIYEASKQAISQMGSRFGYFDASWLSHSVDIVLPDNTADIALLYDAGQQYDFGDVVFFTYDKDSQKLTTDPNKLPLKPELLQQLLTFKTGENYHAPAITKFSNDLSATRYFNTVNVETVLPQRGVQHGVQAGVPSETTTDDDNLNLDGLNHDNLDNDAPDGGNSDNSNLDNSNPDNPNNLDNLDNDNLDGLENIAPIEFEIDTDIENKLFAIEQKAQQLYNQPDDRVLLEDDTQSTTLLGKISDKISDIAGKLDPLPDNLPEHVERPVLANKITPEQVYDSKKVPVYVYVQSDKPRDAQVGFGYGTDSGMRLTGRLDYNLVNRDGYQAGVQTSLSKINKNVSAYVSRPWKHPLDDTIKANVKYEEELIDQGFGSFSLQSKSILAGLLRNVIKDSGWNRTYSIRYRYDDLSSDIDASFYRNLPIRFAAGNDTQQALLFGYGLSKTEADDPINPNFGVRQYYSVEGGAKSLLTDTNMVIAKAGVSGVYGFGEGLKHQVIGGLDGGYIWAKDFFEVPYKLRFFAGGDQSIRGYDYNSLSPLEFDYLYGGQVLAVASFEYNYEFFPGFRGAVFADVGNAYDANFTTDTKVGAGFGIRWASPVGPVRVDLAAGVSENDPPIRLHFFIGSPLR